MPVRSPAQCRRTVARRAAASSQVGIWVTDSMLAQAIEQYHRAVLPPCRRHLNSHAGPLESRRRAGKRHMTGLMPTSSAFPPIWQFDVPSSSMPQWEAPTAPSYRRQKNKQLTVSGLFNNLIGWLEGGDRPLPPPCTDSAAAGVVSMEALAIDVGTQYDSTPGDRLREAAPPLDLPTEIAELRAGISELENATEAALYRLCTTCRRSLRRRIERGELTVEGLVLALDPLDLATRSRISSTATANKMAAMLRRTILSAMADAQDRIGSPVSPELWSALAQQICGTNGDNHDVQLFWRLMDVMPSSLKAQIPHSHLAAFTHAFVAAQANRHNLFPHWASRAARFSNALQRLDLAQRQALDRIMNRYLQEQDWVSEMARRMRFSWLIIKAYDSNSPTREFLDTYKAVVEPGVRLNSMQLWQLLAARLVAVGALDGDQGKALMEAEYHSMSQRWTRLVLAALASPNRDSALQEVCACLIGIGEFDAAAHALTSAPIRHLRMDAVQAIAAACNDHNQAMHLYDAIVVKEGSRQKLGAWEWSSWSPYVEAMIKDPKMDPARIWQVLNLRRSRSSAGDACPKAAAAAAASEVEAKTQLLDRMGRWFMEAEHLSDRQVLRQVQRCVASQRALTDGVSSRTLASVAELITRDLDRGGRGRTSRMRWLVGMVEQTHGTERAERTAEALQGWRWSIDRSRREGS
ncbi:KH domain RNA binding protein [Purpureocillium lavendulum]|uniref:KH domain RNA binding protein n=1 Tax=Purpureocillium lavendulum TaxID=1247861 RepID=A0AB34G4W9_9HYPO|nr:KH domain RNA binding protein [Purpureocillium lavendulum]